MGTDIATLALEIDSSDVSKARKELNTLIKTGKSTDQTFNETISTFKKAGIAATAFAGIAAGILVIGLKKANRAASDLEETQGKFDVLFRTNAKEAESWSKTLVKSYGQSEEESKRFLSSIQDLLVPTGLVRNEAAKMSNQFVKLATDIGSFNNQTTSKVILDFQSALAGGSETLTKYGINVKVAAVQQEAMRLGLIKNKKEMTDAIRAQVILSIATKQSSDAVGDFARTSTSYANRLKLFNATIENLTASFGKKLLPVASDVLGEITQALLNAEGGVDGLSRAFALKLISSIGKVIEVTRFFHNGLSGLILAGDAIVVAFAHVFSFLQKGIRTLFSPLDALFEGLVKLGKIDENPFDKLSKSAEIFKRSSSSVFQDQVKSIERNNQFYDRASSKIKTYIDIVKNAGKEDREKAKASTISTSATDQQTQSTSLTTEATKVAKETQEDFSDKIKESNVFMGQAALAHELSRKEMNGYKTAMQLAFEDSENLDGSIDSLTNSQISQISSTETLSQSIRELGDAYAYANAQRVNFVPNQAENDQGNIESGNNSSIGSSNVVINNNLNAKMGKSDITDISLQQARESSRI